MSVSLGKIMGIPVRIHYTLWFVFILIAWSLAVGYMPTQYPGLSTVTYWAIGIVSAIILFASILIHELSHSYIAKKNGLPIGRITLFFFGGVSEMTEEPQDPGLEVRMAAAGPLMSFLIAAVLGSLWYLGKFVVNAPVAIIATLGYAALINGVLGLFNLLPAFPLDGGRVFRGSLWKHSKSLIGATRTATRVSEALSMLMMLGGFISIIFGDFVDGLWFIVLGWFIKSGAETSLKQTLVGEALTGVSVADIMTRDVLTVPPETTVQRLISDYLLVHKHGAYPVVKNGEVLGEVTLECVRAVPKEKRDFESVQQAMVPCERTAMVKPSTTALDAMQAMARNRAGHVLVVDEGRLVGIATRDDVIRTIHTRQDLELGPSRAPLSSVPTQFPQIRAEHCVQCGALLPASVTSCPQCGAKQSVGTDHIQDAIPKT
ncbi:MAG TPA: site-2 protease family protein [Candidatus Bathyarchaeia archaeon]|nr:site-2 protease family protein [Candidatus Bathyarchaeia archaeon]